MPRRFKALTQRANFYDFLEEGFTSWTIYGRYDTGENWGADMLGVRNNGQVLFVDASADTNYIISPAGVLLATIAGDWNMIETTYLRGASLHDRYVLFRSYNAGGMNMTNIGIQEGLTKLWERAVNDDRGAYTLDASPLWNLTASISSSGEWIAVGVKEAGGNCLIFIYQGRKK